MTVVTWSMFPALLRPMKPGENLFAVSVESKLQKKAEFVETNGCPSSVVQMRVDLSRLSI